MHTSTKLLSAAVAQEFARLNQDHRSALLGIGEQWMVALSRTDAEVFEAISGTNADCSHSDAYIGDFHTELAKRDRDHDYQKRLVWVDEASVEESASFSSEIDESLAQAMTTPLTADSAPPSDTSHFVVRVPSRLDILREVAEVLAEEIFLTETDPDYRHKDHTDGVRHALTQVDIMIRETDNDKD